MEPLFRANRRTSDRRHNGTRRSNGRRCKYARLSDALVFRLVEMFATAHEHSKTVPVQAIVEKINELFGENFSREQAYPILREGLARGFLTLTPPVHLALARRLAERFHLSPVRQQVTVIDVDADPATASRAVQLAAARLLCRRLLEGNHHSELALGLGCGHLVLGCIRALCRLLSAEPTGKLNLSVFPLEPANYAETFPDRSAVSFARLLEAFPRRRVTVCRLHTQAEIEVALLDVSAPGAVNLLMEKCLGDRLLLVPPGGFSAALPWFECPEAFTYVFLDRDTATELAK